MLALLVIYIKVVQEKNLTCFLIRGVGVVVIRNGAVFSAVPFEEM